MPVEQLAVADVILAARQPAADRRDRDRRDLVDRHGGDHRRVDAERAPRIRSRTRWCTPLASGAWRVIPAKETRVVAGLRAEGIVEGRVSDRRYFSEASMAAIGPIADPTSSLAAPALLTA